MSAELIGILAVGVGLATLMLTALRAFRTDLRREIARETGTLRGDMQTLRDGLRGDAHTARDELRADIRGLDERMRTQERGMARLAGLLEGLREAVVVRSGPWPVAGEPVRRQEAQG